MNHLKNERKLTVAKTAEGVYHINKETFTTQIIVTRELSPEDNLYLRCLTNELQAAGLDEFLAADYKLHREQEIYTRYMHQVTTANTKTKGEQTMLVCEGLLNLCGTSSAEIIERAKKESDEYYLPKINQLTSQNSDLTSQNAYLKSLLVKHNIPFDLKSKPKER